MSNRWRMRWRRTPLRTLTVIYFNCWLLLSFCRSAVLPLPNNRHHHPLRTETNVFADADGPEWEERRTELNYKKYHHYQGMPWRRCDDEDTERTATSRARMRWERRLTRTLDALSSAATGSSSKSCCALSFIQLSATEYFSIFHCDGVCGRRKCIRFRIRILLYGSDTRILVYRIQYDIEFESRAYPTRTCQSIIVILTLFLSSVQNTNQSACCIYTSIWGDALAWRSVCITPPNRFDGSCPSKTAKSVWPWLSSLHPAIQTHTQARTRPSISLATAKHIGYGYVLYTIWRSLGAGGTFRGFDDSSIMYACVRWWIRIACMDRGMGALQMYASLKIAIYSSRSSKNISQSQ